MSFDFTKEYTINTAKGQLLVLIFHYMGNLNDVPTGGLDRNNIRYLENSITLDTEYAGSVVGGSKYRYSEFPAMGVIGIKDLNENPTTFSVISDIYSGDSVIGFAKGSTRYTTTLSSIGVSNFVRCGLCQVIVDDYDNYLLNAFNAQNNIDNVAYTQNTATDYGYFEGKLNQLPTFTKPANSLLTNFSTDFEPLLKEFREDTDPYSRGGSSGGGGGTGDFDNTSDTIGLPSLPSLSGLNTGFFTAFVPSASQMQSVSNYLWNNAITDILDPNTGLGEKVDALKKIVANPYDAIMGCSIIPVTPPTAGSKELKMYGLLETGISLPYASSRWVEVDCGTLNIHEFWGGYLDYSPYTKTTSLYLPYIGTVSIDIDLIMAKALRVVYYVDILSGICVAFILVDGSVKFHYQGQCATQIPITNADYSSVISSGIGLIGNASQVVGSAVTGGVGGGVGGAVAGAVAGAISQAPSIASNVMSAKPDIRSGGAIGSSAGILSVQRPYLIIERPKQSVPAFQNHFTGYPSNITAKVSDLTGYTEFETINLDGLFLTDSEKRELEDILKGGVYL